MKRVLLCVAAAAFVSLTEAADARRPAEGWYGGFGLGYYAGPVLFLKQGYQFRNGPLLSVSALAGQINSYNDVLPATIPGWPTKLALVHVQSENKTGLLIGLDWKY